MFSLFHAHRTMVGSDYDGLVVNVSDFSSIVDFMSFKVLEHQRCLVRDSVHVLTVSCTSYHGRF